MISTSTVAAISTAQAAGGLGVIRISGPDALNIANSIFVPASGASLTASKGYRAHFGKVISGNTTVDEAVCLVFRAPHSYTGEDTAEITCHGGLYVTRAVLRAALDAGALPAGPGEFTKRAFLNGKMDLAGSEAVMALISAKGQQAATAALNTLDGRLSKEIRDTADKIIAVSAALAAWVDYPYDEIEDTDSSTLLAVFRESAERLRNLLARYDKGRVFTEGADTVIVGRPNVGKSTLMNLLSGCDRSIVTDIAGTTRDIVEENVRLGELILRIADTAGIHQTDNAVESIGVSLAKKRMERAQLVLAVFDGSEPLTEDDYAILEDCKGKLVLGVLNKSDLPQKADAEAIAAHVNSVVTLSAANGEGEKELEQAVTALLSADGFDPDNPCLAGERQRQCCQRALRHLEDGIAALESGMTLDAVTVCADCAVEALLELTGERATEAVVNEVFSRFCVGK